MRTPALALALAAFLLVPVTPAANATPLVADHEVAVGSETAHGLLATPAGTPLGLVVIMHGYGHTAESHRAHLQHIAEQGYLGVAMDFRGEGMPLRAGADDTLAATNALLAAYDLDFVVLYSVSMGTAAAAMVLAGSDVFDVWVNNEGLAMLAETWAEATAVSPGIPFGATARADIERETGGTPATAPAAFIERSAVLRAPEFTIERAILTHGLNDGLVPYNQGREMAGALRASGILVDFWTVATCPNDSEGTTITGHAGLGGRGICGHGTESNDDHTLTALSFGLLDQVLQGARPGDGEHIVDGTLGTLP